jgi:stage II sporulation protein D
MPPFARLLTGLALPLVLLPPVAMVRAQPQQEPELRVLLAQSPQLNVRGSGSAGLRLRDRQGRILREFGADQALQLRVSGGWVELTALPQSGQAPVVVAGPELWIEPLAASPEDAILWLQQRRYRGLLQVRPDAAAAALVAINRVPLENYLASVVGSEMPASWPQEALRAQAVAARTYALKGRKPAAAFDLQATVASQMYKGVEAETPSTQAAVAGTRGLVLTYGDSLIDAVFHSSSGGSTESSGDLWPRQLPYLVSVPDFDQEAPVSQWRQPLDPALLARAFPEAGGMSQIEILGTTATGRVRQARVLGPQGQLLLSGAQLRSRLGLRSTWVRFEVEPAEAPPAPVTAALASGMAPPPLLPPLEPAPARQWVAVGRGFGHGIGMSQWGALALARRGEGYQAILEHYYRGTQLRPYSAVVGLELAASNP